jgi:hypothetical protein
MSARLRLARQLLAELRTRNAGPALMCEGLVDDLPLADDDAATWAITAATCGQQTPARPPAVGAATGASARGHRATQEDIVRQHRVAQGT